MKSVELTLTSGSKATFFINGNVVIFEETSKNYPEQKCAVQDGNHNNGGWKIMEDYQTVIELIKNSKDV